MKNRPWGFGEGSTRAVFRMFDWVGTQPAWLQPALFGAGLIYAFAISRGGLVVIPLFVLAAVLWHLTWATRLLLCVMVLAPAGGFLGGLAYSALSPIARRIGRAGRVLQFVVACFFYGLVLQFAIEPLLSNAPLSLPQPADVKTDLVFAGIIGLLGGVALSAPADGRAVTGKTNWALVAGVILVGGILAAAMIAAGWTS